MAPNLNGSPTKILIQGAGDPQNIFAPTKNSSFEVFDDVISCDLGSLNQKSWLRLCLGPLGRTVKCRIANSTRTLRYPYTSQKGHFPEKHFPEKHFPQRTPSRMYI